MIDRRALILAAAALGLGGPALAASPRDGARDFDLLAGRWRVRHRYLRVTAVGKAWREAEGPCLNTPLAGGWGNVEEYVFAASGGQPAHEAFGLRAYDPATGLWSIWWLDGRDPSAAMEPPCRGRFEADGVGRFFADTVIDGRPTRIRLMWTKVTPQAGHWEQAYSPDAGRTWETNWTMDFDKLPDGAPPGPPAPQEGRPPAPHDFDFLYGTSAVHHRKHPPGAPAWLEFEGTCTTRPLMGGRCNMEEHWIDDPRGAYRAAGLRAFDPKTGRWSIRWWDQRYPSRPVDPAVVGRFEGGVGRFYSDYEVDGKAARGRLMWSQITATSAHWEQAQSLDGGESWEPNWTMQFSRRA